MKKRITTLTLLMVIMAVIAVFAEEDREHNHYYGDHKVNNLYMRDTDSTYTMTKITASASEINASIDGLTATAAELNAIVDGGTNISDKTIGLSGIWAGSTLANADPSVAHRYFNDFIEMPEDDTTQNPLGWKFTGDSNKWVLTTAGIGGVLDIIAGDADNDETFIQLGPRGTEASFVIATNGTGTAGKRFVYEVRVKGDSGDGAAFVGMAGAGSSTADFLVEDTGIGGDFNFVGFRTVTASSNQWDFVYKAIGMTAVTNAAIVTNSDQWVTFAMAYDGLQTLTYYVNGTVSTNTHATTNSTFPAATNMNPIFAQMVSAAVYMTSSYDWVKIEMDRTPNP